MREIFSIQVGDMNEQEAMEYVRKIRRFRCVRAEDNFTNLSINGSFESALEDMGIDPKRVLRHICPGLVFQ